VPEVEPRALRSHPTRLFSPRPDRPPSEMPTTFRRSRRPFLLALGSLMAVVLVLGPGAVASRLNPHPAPPGSPPSDGAARLHRSLSVADLHADPLLWDVDLTTRRDQGHVDLPRLARGRVAVQTMSVVTRVPWGAEMRNNRDGPDIVTPLAVLQLWPPRTWWSLRARAVHQAGKLRRASADSGGRRAVDDTRADLDAFLGHRLRDEGTVAAVLALEGAHALEGDPANVALLYREGFRMIGLVHLHDNEVGGSAHGAERGGLTEVGERVLEAMARSGMILDLAHASPRLIDDVLARWDGPLVVSHTGVQGTCPGPRNLDDRRLSAIAAAGGVIGIGAWPDAVCGTTPRDWATAVRYAVDMVGSDRVALGSDWDGAVPAIVDAGGTVYLVEALLEAGFEAEEVRRIMGLNTIRLLRSALP